MIAAAVLAAMLAGPAAGPACAKSAVKRWASELDGADLPTQIVAARVLGRLGKPEGVDPLLSRLDPRRASPRLTAAIVQSLGELHDKKALEPLTGVWDYLNSARLQLGSELPAAQQTLRALVVEAIGELGDSSAAPLLEEALGDKDPAVVDKAALALGQVGDTGSVEALIALLPRGGNTTQAACEALGRLGDPRGLNALQALARGDDSASQVEAAYGLALCDKKAQDALARLMHDEKRELSNRLLAAYYLARLDNASGLDFLGRLAQKAGTPGDQAHAVEALGKSRNPRAVGPLLEAARSSDAPTRLLAAQGLGRLGGPKAVNGLRKLEEDRAQTVKAAARVALNDLGED